MHTGRIGSRQQLAENVWLVSLRCSGGVQRYCGVHLYIIQRWFKGKPILLKIGRFSLYACGNGLDLPHLTKRAFRDQIGPNVQKAMLLGSPSHQGLKNCRFSQKYFFSFLTIFQFLVISLPFSRCWPYFEAGMLFGGFSSTRVT